MIEQETLNTDILDSVYNRYILGDENGDNLNPKREVQVTSVDTVSEIIQADQLSTTIAQVSDAFTQIKEREPADFNEVIKEALESAVVSANGPDGLQKILDAKKLGLDEIDGPLLDIANPAPSVAPSAVDALEKDISIEILKLMLYLKAKELLTAAPPPDLIRVQDTLQTQPDDNYIPLSIYGPWIKVPEGEVVVITVDDVNGPSLDLPDEFVFSDGVWVLGPAIEVPLLPPGTHITLTVGNLSDSESNVYVTEIDIPTEAPASDSEEGGGGSGSGSGGSGGEGGGGSGSGGTINLPPADGFINDTGTTQSPPITGVTMPATGGGDSDNTEFEDFFTLDCDGTLEILAFDDGGTGATKTNSNSRYQIGKIKDYSKGGTDGDGDGDGGGGGGGGGTTGNNSGFKKYLVDGNGNCVQYQLTILQVLLAIVKSIKLIAALIDPVGIIIAEIARMVALAAGAWRNPPQLAELIAMLASKVKAILVKLLGAIMDTMYKLMPATFCAIEITDSLINQLKDAILAIGSVGVEINNLSSSFVNLSNTAATSVKDATNQILQSCTEILNGLSPDRLSQGARNFKELTTTANNALKNEGIDVSSWNAAENSAVNLLKEGLAASGAGPNKAVQDVLDIINVSKELSSVTQKSMSEFNSSTFGSAGAIAQIAGIFTKPEEGTNVWADWADTAAAWSDFTTAAGNDWDQTVKAVQPIGTIWQLGAAEGGVVRDSLNEKITNPQPVQYDSEGHPIEQPDTKISDLPGYQKAKDRLKDSEDYQAASRPEQLVMLKDLAEDWKEKYGKK